ncbi:MAG: GDSL-type esterase/lipase family protein [Acidobacteriota bacterium]|nr:GDSL-type esterase/lipase family protein [Acidobacteriota bacterium]
MRKVFLALALLALACRAHPKIKPSRPVRLMDGVMRVVVVGDSLAHGTGDDSGKGIPGNLEDEFKQRGIPADVKNYGVAGATTGDVENKLHDEAIRADLAGADAIVLSVGANNVFQDPEARARAIRDRDTYAQEILNQVAGVVAQIRAINPDAELMLLGGYNPLPDHPLSGGISRYIKNWDKLMNNRFEADPLIDVVKTSDIVDSGDKLAGDHFHPGAAAYREIAKRIADLLMEQIKTV